MSYYTYHRLRKSYFDSEVRSHLGLEPSTDAVEEEAEEEAEEILSDVV